MKNTDKILKYIDIFYATTCVSIVLLPLLLIFLVESLGGGILSGIGGGGGRQSYIDADVILMLVGASGLIFGVVLYQKFEQYREYQKILKQSSASGAWLLSIYIIEAFIIVFWKAFVG